VARKSKENTVSTDRFDVSGKVIVITGGSRGLGKAMSLGLAAAGAKVVVASRKLDNCQQLVGEIKAAGGDALAVSAHTGAMGQLDNLIDQTYAHFGRVDVLINNAGTNPVTATLSDLSPELFDKVIGVNLKGPWYLASRMAPRMAADGGGSIINMISVGGLRPAAYQGFYATSKAGLEAMTRVMAQEWAGQNIRVNSIAPGAYHSDLFDVSAAALPGFEEGARSASLMQRIANTDEILGPVFYLASEASSYTTGSCMVADGGYLAK
jgi:NAD(P)-dependent dehydrogenase (short-subunit alcohol dehydrogenase family)